MSPRRHEEAPRKPKSLSTGSRFSHERLANEEGPANPIHAPVSRERRHPKPLPFLHVRSRVDRVCRRCGEIRACPIAALKLKSTSSAILLSRTRCGLCFSCVQISHPTSFGFAHTQAEMRHTRTWYSKNNSNNNMLIFHSTRMVGAVRKSCM